MLSIFVWAERGRYFSFESGHVRFNISLHQVNDLKITSHTRPKRDRKIVRCDYQLVSVCDDRKKEDSKFSR